MGRLLVAFCSMAVFSLACQAVETVGLLVATSTPTLTPSPSVTPPPSATATPTCNALPFLAAIRDVPDKLLAWTNGNPYEPGNAMAKSSTISTALTEMRTLKTTYANIAAPDCAQSTKRALTSWHDGLIDMYGNYQKTKDDLALLKAKADVLDRAQTAIDELKRLADRAGLIPTVTPAAVIGNSVRIIDWTWYRSPSGSYLYVDGQVQNISPNALRSVRITVTLRDAKKSLLATDSGLIDVPNLAPGQISTFKIMTPYRPGVDTVAISNVDWR